MSVKKSVQRWYIKETGLFPQASSGLQKGQELLAACFAEAVERVVLCQRCCLILSVLPTTVCLSKCCGPHRIRIFPSSVNGSGSVLPDAKIPCSHM
jgi:hypothetical protein